MISAPPSPLAQCSLTNIYCMLKREVAQPFGAALLGPLHTIFRCDWTHLKINILILVCWLWEFSLICWINSTCFKIQCLGSLFTLNGLATRFNTHKSFFLPAPIVPKAAHNIFMYYNCYLSCYYVKYFPIKKFVNKKRDVHLVMLTRCIGNAIQIAVSSMLRCTSLTRPLLCIIAMNPNRLCYNLNHSNFQKFPGM